MMCYASAKFYSKFNIDLNILVFRLSVESANTTYVMTNNILSN